MEIVGWTLLGILVGVLGLIVLALCLPLRVKIEYLEHFRLKVYLFGILRVYTMKEHPEHEQEPEKESKKEKKAASTTEKPKKEKLSLKDELKDLKQQEGIGGVIAFFKRMLAIATGAFKRVIRSVTVRRLQLCVRVGGYEADTVAQRYGSVSAALSSVLTALSGVMRFRRKQVVVQPDFIADTVSVRMRMVLWVWPLGVLAALLGALFKYLFALASMKSAPTANVKTNTSKKTTSQ